MLRREYIAALALALIVATAGSLTMIAPSAAIEPDEPPPYHARHFELVDLPFDRLPWTSDPPPALPGDTPPHRAARCRPPPQSQPAKGWSRAQFNPCIM